MSKHQVFIESCRDQRPETAKALAAAVAARYGIDPQQIEGRLQKGRFQVKANLDIDAARLFVSYLESEGALCSIVDQTGQTVMRSAALASPSPSIERYEVSMPELADDDEFALHTPPPPPDFSDSDYESGLSAGFGSAGSAQSLGALDNPGAAASASFQLAALDGSSGESVSHVEESVDGADAFMPPDMLEQKALELDVDEPPASALVESSTPVASLESTLGEQIADGDYDDRPAQEASGPAAPLPARVLGLLSRNERVRFAFGVVLAVLLGFVAVHVYASGQETSRYDKVLSELKAEYAAADTAAAWSNLDEARSHAMTSLKERRSTIVVTSTLIWLAVAGLLCFAWLRLIRWSRWQDLGLPETTPTS